MLDLTRERTTLAAQWQAMRAETDALFGLVEPAALFDRPVAERHRLAFYIGHLEAFDWNLLAPALGLHASRADLDHLFAFGIDPVDGNLPSDTPADWPALPAFFAYRDAVRAELDAALASDAATRAQGLRTLLHTAIEHRALHAETLSYLLHRLPVECKRGALVPATELDQTPLTPRRTSIPAGRVTLGLARASGRFGWDNEFEAHAVDVPAFVIDRFKVSNAQFLAFVEDGGYARRELWRDADWAWREAAQITHPAFWAQHACRWHWRAMFGLVPLPAAWPVYVSHAEASAYARWVGRALPTEAQWQRAAFGDAAEPAIDAPDAQPLRFEPRRVDDPALIRSGPFDVAGLHGNGWEWTSTPFAPFSGFAPIDAYLGYSQPFFDGEHFVLKGGSPRTAPSMLRPSFRNWFQAHYPYVYAGFRCVDH